MKSFVIFALIICSVLIFSDGEGVGGKNSDVAAPVMGRFSSKTVTNLASSTSYLLVGKSNGEMLKCPFTDEMKYCETVNNSGGEPINVIIASGEYIYAGLQSGEMWRCDLLRPHSCIRFNHAGRNAIRCLAIHGRFLYAGLDSGLMWRCNVNETNMCEGINQLGRGITSLAISGDFIFAGINSNKIFRCNLHRKDSCTEINMGHDSITAITTDYDYVYVGFQTGKMLRCSFITGTDCWDMTIHQDYSTIQSIVRFDSHVYALTQSGFLMACDTNGQDMCWPYAKLDNARSIFPIYKYLPMDARYENENTRCSWQSVNCPPFVMYYNIADRVEFELQVLGGTLRDINGRLFDTNNADESYSGKRAKFVMDISGRIFAINRYPKYWIHHSSLIAGSVVSAAGEISVNNGIIAEINACSCHYARTEEVNDQMINALRIQGYTESVYIMDCMSEHICD